MFSYGTGGLHALPLHLVRFLWLPALNVCSLIGDRFLLLVPILPQIPFLSFMWFMCCTTPGRVLLVWCGYKDLHIQLESVQFSPEDKLPSCVDGPFPMHASNPSHPSVIML